MDFNSLAKQSPSPDTIIVGKRPARKKNSSQPTWPVDEDYPIRTRRHYIGTETYLDARTINWYTEKTGFPLPVEHIPYFFTLPFGCAKDLINLPNKQTDSVYESGIAFCHLDGTIYQYRPFTAQPSWEIVNNEWVPGRPIKYFTVNPSLLEADGITPVKISPKPLFLPKIRDYPGSPNVLVITEGFTKAACLSHLGFDSVHLPGVTTWATPRAEDVLKGLQGKYDYFVVAFDSDAETNISVKREQIKLAKAYNARIATWSETAKGFDDLCLEVGVDDTKTLRQVIINATVSESGYLVPNKQRPYPIMLDTIREAHPSLFFDGRYWINEGKRVSKNNVDKLLINELQKFYVISKTGKEFLWATKYKETIEYLTTYLTQSDMTNITYLQNGYLDAGKFYPSNIIDPRALSWKRLDTYQEPQELINFFEKCHGNLNYRYWLRSLFDNSIPYGAILGVNGLSGAGKSFTLSIAQLLLGELHCQNSSLMLFETNERIAGFGNPKALIQSDCQKLPTRMDELFVFTDSSPMAVRVLYQTGYETRRFYCRVAFGCVNIPHVSGANEGFSRRFKLITCQKYEGMINDIQKLANLLKDHDYLNRIFNWVMDASHSKTLTFMNPVTPKGISPEIQAQGTYKFFDRTLIPAPPTEEVSVRDYYEVYRIFTQRQQRKSASYEDFLSTLVKCDIPLLPGAQVRLPSGSFITTDDIMNTKVDERCLNAADFGNITFFGINTKYFSSREIVQKRESIDIKECHIIFTNHGAEDDIQISASGETQVINPSIPTLNSISNDWHILSLTVDKDYKFNNLVLPRIVNELKKDLDSLKK